MIRTPIVLSRYSEHDRAHAERIHRELSAMGLEPRGETVEQELQRELAVARPEAHHVPENRVHADVIDEAEAPAYVLLFWSANARAHSSANALTSLIGRAEHQSSVIVPVRLDDTELPGLLGSISSIDARGGPDAELAAVREFLGREGFGPERRPRELAPRPRGAVSCRDTLSAMQNRALRVHLKTRLSLNDVREIWIDTFASRLDDDLPNAPLGLALAELLLRADQRRVRDELVNGLCAGWPHLGGSPRIDGLEPPRRAPRAEARPPAAPPPSPPGDDRNASAALAVAAPAGATVPASAAALSGAPLHDGDSATTVAPAAPSRSTAQAGLAAPAALAVPAGDSAATVAPAAPSPSTAQAGPSAPAAPASSPASEAGRAAASTTAEVAAAKDALERDFTGFWGFKVFWLALFTLLPLLAPLKLHFLHLEVSPATCYYGVYHGLGIWLWASVRDGFKRPRLYKDHDWLAWWRWSNVHHRLGYGVYLLLAATLLVKLTLVFYGPHTIPFPSWVREFLGI